MSGQNTGTPMKSVIDVLFGTEPIQWIQSLFGLGYPLPFRIFSLLGDTWGILFVLGFAFWLFGRRPFYALVSIVVVGAVIKVLISEVIHHPRPQGSQIVVYEHLEVSSFPSGHVFEAVGPWGLLYALGYVRVWVPTLIAVLVSAGRLYLGVHFLGDVLAGVVLGALVVWTFAKLWPRLRAWLAERGRLFYFAFAAIAVVGMAGWIWMSGAHPRRYEVFGMVLAAAVGLPLEYHFLRYSPGDRVPIVQKLKAIVGGLGIAAFLVWNRNQDQHVLLLAALTAGLATLWTVLGAPWLLSRQVFGQSSKLL